MIIQSSNMQLSSARMYASRGYHMQGAQVISQGLSIEQDATEGKNFAKGFNSLLSAQSIQSPNFTDQLTRLDDMRRKTMDYLLNILFGRRMSATMPANMSENTTSADGAKDITGITNSEGSQLASGGQFFTVATTRYTSYFHYEENETTSFLAQGKVVTADGRQIDLNIDLTLSRTFVEETQTFIDYTSPVVCDPLVIQLDGNLPEVLDQKFTFDLDMDGEEEEISRLGAGNGFLALDKNGDGIINDGSELFGVRTGNGFGELSAYDEDGNGWIDEADEIFEKLRIWYKDENDNDKLMDLKESGVGAIHLGSADTQFSYNNAANQTNAIARQTGIFLYENGNVGTIQQLDMAT